MIWMFIAALLWGPSFGLIPILIEEHGMNAYTLAFFRMVYSLLLFLPLLRIRIIARRKRIILIGLGALQFGAMYVLLNLSYSYMKGYEIAMVTVFTPLYVSLIDSYFTGVPHEKFRHAVCVLLAVLGAMVIRFARPESSGFWIGFGIMQIANACFAFGQVAYRRLLPSMKRFGDMHVFGWMYFGAMLLTGAVWLAIGEPFTSLRTMGHMSIQGWLILLWLGLIPSGLAFFLFNHGALEVNATTLSIFNNLKIPLAMLIVMLLFRQWSHIDDWARFSLGAAMMLFALFWNEWSVPPSFSRRRTPRL